MTKKITRFIEKLLFSMRALQISIGAFLLGACAAYLFGHSLAMTYGRLAILLVIGLVLSVPNYLRQENLP